MVWFMKYNDNILERIGEFYADLDSGKWTDFLIRKPENFDTMEFGERLRYAYDMMEKIDKIMEDPWQVVKTWGRRNEIKHPKYGTLFDTFMEYELDYLTQKEKLQNQQNGKKLDKKKHFWSRSQK